MFARASEYRQLEWGHQGLVCHVLAAGETEGLGQLLGRLRASPRPVTVVSILSVCACTRVHILLMDFHPDQRGAGGGCWCCLCLPKC